MTKEEIEFFDRISATWDDDEKLSTAGRIMSILSKTDIQEGMKILDLGTGTGVLISFLSRLTGPHGEITAIDISSGMLKKAVEKFGDLKNVRFVKKDFEKERIEGRFDIIMLYCVYPHLHKPKETLHSLLDNNLTNKGKIYIAFPTDEKFINGIHKERKAESDLLPQAPLLAEKISTWGFMASTISYSPDEYLIEIKKSDFSC